MSRTNPMKLATPPIRELPAARRSSSAPTSKSSRCARIIALASGHRRENCDLVTLTDGVLEPDITLIDRHPDDRKISQRLGISAAARPQPIEQAGHVLHSRRQVNFLFGAADPRTQPGEINQLHPITSENGRKSTVMPGARSLVSSSTITSPSDRVIEERMPARSLGYLTAIRSLPSRCRLALTYSRRPGFLR